MRLSAWGVRNLFVVYGNANRKYCSHKCYVEHRFGVKKMSKMAYGERYTLSIKEAASYFNIGIKKMRKLAEENLGILR